MPASNHRLSILSTSEIDDLYGLPRFTSADRDLFFQLSGPELAAVAAIRTVSVAVHLILQLGYFKAKRQFFAYEREDAAEDLDHVINQHFPGTVVAVIKTPSRPIQAQLHQTILKLFDYRHCDGKAKVELEQRALRTARLTTLPLHILKESLQNLTHRRIVAPGYRFMQDMVGRVVARERKRITGLLEQVLTSPLQTRLDKLLTSADGMHRISALKREPKDFSHNELEREVKRRNFFEPLHDFAKTFLAMAEISTESGKYYASLVKFYTVYKLQRMAPSTAQLYLVCFAYHRFRQINDNLVEALIHWVDVYEKQAKAAADIAMQQALLAASENLQAAGQVLSLFVDPAIPMDTPFSVVKEKAFGLLAPAQFPLVSDYLRDVTFDKTAFEWAYYTKLSPTFKRNLRQLFADLDFAARIDNAPLLDAILFMQALFRKARSPRQTPWTTFPTQVVAKSLHPYLFPVIEGKETRLDVDRYEFLVYRLLRNALESGDVFVRDSIEFRRFEDDLITDARWENKDTVLQEVGLPVLLAPIQETLTTLLEGLDAKLCSVNLRIAEGLNRHIKIPRPTSKRQWTLVYPTAEEPDNHPFYSQLPGVGIADLLRFVAGATGFLKEFAHVLDRYVKHDPNPQEILACIVAMGTNMGLWKMADVSGLGHPSLMTTSRNYLRLETLHAANDAISNATALLPAFQLFKIRDELHSSSDGQRMQTQINTFNARHSPKYFGLQKGVSSYTLVANHVPINAKIIGTHEHESHYVFDLLHNNTTDIKPARHSTDTHGTNQVNFWILYAFGYRFAPRYRDLHKKMESLVGARLPRHYDNAVIKPSRQVHRELIESEWPNIQRIMVSLAQKDVTQATIIRKLSSYARQNQTKKALWELENICRTLYILDFIDDVELRQNVQKALNRGEAYHRLRRAVAYVNGGKFRVQTEAEQQVWNECSRLITNAIIYYNTALLSRVYAQKQSAQDQAAMEVIHGMSPVAWQHINLIGQFEFSAADSKVDIDALVERYADPDCWNKTLQPETGAT
jgi:TnpA family transposase